MASRKPIDEEPFELEFDEEGRAIEIEDDEAELDKPAPDPEEDEEIEDEPEAKRSRPTKRELDDANARAAQAEGVAREALDAMDRIQQQMAAGVPQAKVDEAKKALETKVTEVKTKIKRAKEDDDLDKETDLLEELAGLKSQQQALLVLENQAKNQPKQEQVVRPDPKAVAWKSRNPWFDANPEARDFAVLTANRVQREGILPSNDEYYKRVDAAMKQRFPELFDADEPKKKTDPPAVKPVDRSGGAGKKPSSKVELSALQVRLAKKWGVSLESVAKEKQKLERRGGTS